MDFDHRDSNEQAAVIEAEPYGGLNGLSKLLKTDLVEGLKTLHPETHSISSVTLTNGPIDEGERIESFGRNVIPPPKSKTILGIIWNTILTDPILKLLIIGAILVLIFGSIIEPEGGWVEGLAILIAVLIVLTVTAGNDYSKDQKFRRLLLLQSDKKVKVVRDAKTDQISSWDVLVGDIVKLTPGDEIPADGIFVSGTRLTVDESPLTGESVPVKKSSKRPFLFSGCQVSEGIGLMLVTAVGENSAGGRIQILLNESQLVETVLQTRLRSVALIIGKLGITAGIVTFLGLTIRWAVDIGNSNEEFQARKLVDLLHFFVTGVIVIVVAVPEGLPLAVTIALAFSMFKMIKDNCFVRHLNASETMGEATCICTDKTGTLTENRMSVVKFYGMNKAYSGEGSGEENNVKFSPDLLNNQSFVDLISEGICTNSTCFIKYEEKSHIPVFVGSATEGALLIWAQKMGHDYEKIRDTMTKIENGQLEFSSETKRMITTIKPIFNQEQEWSFRVHVKGASEIILERCDTFYDFDGSIIKIDEGKRGEIKQIIDQWAKDGLRTLTLAYKHISNYPELDEETKKPKDLDTNLTFLGLFGIKDPIRKEVPSAVAECQNAGLVVRMVTGDNILTASKIAQESGILTDNGLAIEGPQFRNMSSEEKRAIIPNLQVLARSSPSDKFILVSLLREMDEVVAVTGDGTNDAPALKQADVGFAMGLSGTQIAMNASDIMLLDDNFTSIVQSIKWGRNVLIVIRRFIQFQLAINLAAILITFVGSLASPTIASPLSAVQLLWINLIMDSFGALALASDDPDNEIMKKPPHKKSEPLVTRQMFEYIGIVCFYEVLMSLLVLFELYKHVGVSSTDTNGISSLVFTTFVFMQITNQICTRQLEHEYNIFHGILKNRLFILMVFIVILIQVLIVELAGEFVGARALSGEQWGLCLGIALGFIPFTLFGRVCFRLIDRYIELLGQKKGLVSFAETETSSPENISLDEISSESSDLA